MNAYVKEFYIQMVGYAGLVLLALATVYFIAHPKLLLLFAVLNLISGMLGRKLNIKFQVIWFGVLWLGRTTLLLAILLVVIGV